MYSFNIDTIKNTLVALQADKEIWENFQKIPLLYPRERIDTIQIKKKQPELFESRLQKLLESTKAKKLSINNASI
ncbi:MAG: YdeI/OmpD-associated family protein [Lachnospiraceae bacterium]|nr:YdeI/OmpD-associated family protein [Lachnospiraceae bacterium]